jgi:Cu-processing system ATP-binding protein
MIEIRGLEKRFAGSPVLRGVDLEARPGRVTALVGPNAAGKTTLIKSVLGLVRPDAGRIRVAGRTVEAGCEYRRAIGYMPQLASFPGNLTGEELLRMLRDLRRGERVDGSLAEELGIAAELRKPLRSLSGGTRQKVSAVAAFLFDPEILILDEPSAGLDPVASGVLKDRIAAARDAGKTLLLTSHVMSELEELSDDVVFLLDGRVRYDGPAPALKLRTRQVNLERAIAWLMRGEAA